MIDLTHDDDAQAVIEAAGDMLARVAPLDRLRGDGSDDGVHAALAEWGWFAMAAPADEGGFGLGLAELAEIWIEAGRRLVSPTVLATALAASHGPAGWQAAMRSGELRASFAVGDGAGMHFCLGSPHAAMIVELRETGVAFFDGSAFDGEAVDALDEAIPTARGALTGEPLVQAASAGTAQLLLAALQAGNAAGAAVLAIDYAQVREQFGQPIGSFQAVKHRCADMGVNAFAAEAQVILAAACMAECAPESERELAAAIIQSNKASRLNGAGVVQVHGGMGFTEECHAHRFFKRAHVLRLLRGATGRLQERLLAID